MPTQLLLTVFIASPGDLVEERRIAREVVDEVNRTLGRVFGVHVELVGWEDTLPGGGRPQELINRDVARCDLFVGLLWGRWGTATGEYSSGFEEEFERARRRRRESGSPEMWLSFKAIDRNQLADPGEQLTKVLGFRQAQETARELLSQRIQGRGGLARKVSRMVDHLHFRPREDAVRKAGGCANSTRRARRRRHFRKQKSPCQTRYCLTAAITESRPSSCVPCAAIGSGHVFTCRFINRQLGRNPPRIVGSIPTVSLHTGTAQCP